MEDNEPGAIFDQFTAALRSHAERISVNAQLTSAKPMLYQMVEAVAVRDLPTLDVGHRDQLRDYLFRGVVYLTLNHTPLGCPDRRDFVALLNPKHMDLELIARSSKQWPTTQEKHPKKYSLETLILPAPPSIQDMPANLEGIWRRGWRNYQAQTKALEKKGHTTWNQFLLRHSRNPVPVGLCWNRDEPVTRINDAYIPIELDHNQLFEPTTDTNADACGRLRATWQRMDPENASVLDGTAITIQQLIRYYACYGGSAFLSLQLSIGTDPVDNTGVLSLCTENPVDAGLMRLWQLIASCIFSPLLAHDVRLLRQQTAKRTDKIRERLTSEYQSAIERVAMFPTDIEEAVGDPLTCTNGLNKHSKLLVVLFQYVRLLHRDQSYWDRCVADLEWDPERCLFIDTVAADGSRLTLEKTLHKLSELCRRHRQDGDKVDVHELFEVNRFPGLRSTVARIEEGWLRWHINRLVEQGVLQHTSDPALYLVTQAEASSSLPLWRDAKMANGNGTDESILYSAIGIIGILARTLGLPTSNPSQSIARIVQIGVGLDEVSQATAWFREMRDGEGEDWIKELCRKFAETQLRWKNTHTWPPILQK